MGRIDFDDMPLLAVRALRENEWLPRALRAKYPVIVVDEYQDLGRALHRMVMGLCFSAGMRLFAVGDADQSIYGFTGAHPDLLQQISKRDDVETVQLRLNYRCASRIVTASSYALGEHRDYEAVDGAEDGTIYFHPRSGQYPKQAQYLFATLLPAIRERFPDLPYGEIGILYPAAWIGDAVAQAAQEHGIPTLRTDTNSLYPRASRLLRWLEQCAGWCCGGWKTGTPRFARLANEGKRLFSETLLTDEDFLAFQRQLLAALWGRRNAALPLHRWLNDLRDAFVENLTSGCRTLQDEAEIFEAFLERTANGGDYADLLWAGLPVRAKARNASTSRRYIAPRAGNFLW